MIKKSRYGIALENTLNKYNKMLLDELLQNALEDVKGTIEILELNKNNYFTKSYLERMNDKIRVTYVDGEGKDNLLKVLQGYNKQFDIILWSWEIPESKLKSILKECRRLLKSKGKMGICFERNNSLPEMKIIYPELELLYKELLPADKEISSHLRKAGFYNRYTKHKDHIYRFKNHETVARWIVHTGPAVSEGYLIENLLNSIKKADILWLTYRFFYGIFEIA